MFLPGLLSQEATRPQAERPAGHSAACDEGPGAGGMPLITLMLATAISAWTWTSPYVSDKAHNAVSLDSGILTYRVYWTGGKDANAYTQRLPISEIACVTQDGDGDIHVYGRERYRAIVREDTGRTFADDDIHLVTPPDDAAAGKRILGQLEAAIPRVRAKFGTCHNAVDLYHLTWHSPQRAHARRVLAYTGMNNGNKSDYVLYADDRTLFVDSVNYIGDTVLVASRDNLAFSRVGCVKRTPAGITVNGLGSADVVSSFTDGTLDTKPSIDFNTADAAQEMRVWRALTSMSSAFAQGLKRCTR